MTAQLVDPATDPAWPAAVRLAIGEWTDWGNHPAESWTYLSDEEKVREIEQQLRRARWILANGEITDATVRAS